MFRNRYAAVLLALFIAVSAFAPSAQAQTRRHHRESAINHQQRVARNIQDTYSHKYELFGGGGYLRFAPGPVGPNYTVQNVTSVPSRINEVSWNVAGTYYLHPSFGIVADVRGHYGNARLFNNEYGVTNPLITEYTFLGGPEYRFYRREKIAIGAQLLGGMTMGNFDGGSKAVPASLLGMWPTSNRLAAGAGLTMDYNIYPNLAVRVTPTYVFTSFTASGVNMQDSFGLNAGIVYRWGRQ